MENPIQKLFNPLGVAIIGASANQNKLSYSVVRNLTEHGYSGGIYPVNPKGGKILGHEVFPSILDVPDPVDLAVIMVNARITPSALEQCGQRGLKVVIVVSGGFKETGEQGELLESQLKDIIDTFGMRLVGPNCVGVMDTYLPLDTTFISHMPSQGHIGFVSHSGAICGGTIDWAISAGVGFSRILSLGNQLDVDIADGIQLLYLDNHTRVISVYAEGLPNGRKFVHTAKQVCKYKPIIILKAGLTTSGIQAVSSHTGALAGSLHAYQAACHRAGIIVVNTLQEQNDVARMLASQPLSHGNRVALLTNAGGPAAVAADALDQNGLCLAQLSEETKDQLKSITPPGTQFGNPVDMLGGPTGEMYKKAGCILLEDPGVDMLLSIFVPQALTPVIDVAQGVIDSVQQHNKPVACCLVGGFSTVEATRHLNSNGVPHYQDPSRASRALASLVQYKQLLEREDLTPKPINDVDTARVRNLLKNIWKHDGAGFIPVQQAAEILHAYGITIPHAGIATSADQAVTLAENIRYPVALKLVGKGIIHKTEIGGLALNLQNPSEVRQAYQRMTSTHSQKQAMVQSMVLPGKEIIIGIQRDSQFGPVLMFGAGGTYVEVSHDVAFRLAPLCRSDAEAMIQETIIGKILAGIRGNPSSDIESVVDVLLRVGQLAQDFPAITELDINPLIVNAKGQGCSAVDIRIAIDQGPE